MKKAIAPPMAAIDKVPRKNQIKAATPPPAMIEPSSRPKIVRKMPPPTSVMIRRNGKYSPIKPRSGTSPSGSGAGSDSPSITFRMQSAPSAMPPAKSPLRNFSAMISSIIRLAVASFSAPSRP